jgi:hypothetical protein
MSDRQPDYSVMRDGRLVAQIFAGAPGAVHCTGAKGRSLGELAYADILVFVNSCAAELLALANRGTDLDTLLFELGLEGFSYRPGAVLPTAALRRL